MVQPIAHTDSVIDPSAPVVPSLNGLPPIPTFAALRPISSIIADLSKPLPNACVKQKPAKNSKTGQITQIDFLHWYVVTQILDAYAPGWSSKVVAIQSFGGKIVMTCEVAIPCAEGVITQQGTGQEDEDFSDGYGDSTSNAEAMALKRAAAKFGVGRYLYDKDGAGAGFTAHVRTQKEILVKQITEKVGTDQAEVFWRKARAQQGADRINALSLEYLHQVLAYVERG